jgi:hypothetical protein
MTNPNPLFWWQDHMQKIEELIEYRRSHNMPVPESDYALLARAREMCVRYVTQAITNGESDDR